MQHAMKDLWEEVVAYNAVTLLPPIAPAVTMSLVSTTLTTLQSCMGQLSGCQRITPDLLQATSLGFITQTHLYFGQMVVG